MLNRLARLMLALGTGTLTSALAPALAAPAIPDILVARIDDLGKPFDLKANLYLPAGGAPTPLVLYLHGKGGSYNAPKDRLAGCAEPAPAAVGR